MNENIISLIYHLYYSNQPKTTTELAKTIFEPRDTEETRNADRKIRYYIEEKIPELIETKQQDGNKKITLKQNRVYLGVGKMTVLTPKNEEIDIGFGDVLVYIDRLDNPRVVSVTFEDEKQNQQQNKNDKVTEIESIEEP